MGYWLAGFDVIGVDVNPMPHYPFEFVQADAMEVLSNHRLGNVAAIHASPPCQAYSCTRTLNPHSSKYPKLIEPLRNLLRLTGFPYVIENVEGAKAEMIDPVTLCGTQFGARADFNGTNTYLRRHRCFEGDWPLPDAGPHDHTGYAFPVFGHGPGGSQNPYIRGKGGAATARKLMQIDWMTRDEINEAIPPAYTEYVGTHLLTYLRNGMDTPYASVAA
jgi:DNA (cytosine-5)-methyltransferase 1